MSNFVEIFFAVILALVVAEVPLHAVAQPVEKERAETCPHPKGWKPADLPRILSMHQEWVEKWRADFLSREWAESHSQERANLCNANLSDIELNGANLGGAKLNDANLSDAKLNKADLVWAELTGAKLSYAQLNEANLSEAKLNGANLIGAELNNANLAGAKLNNAHLSEAKLNKALLGFAELKNVRLDLAELNEANLGGAKLDNAHLIGTILNEAILVGAKLDNADLTGAKLNGTNLLNASIANTRLAYTDLTNAIYAPASPPPDPYVVDIRGLWTVTFLNPDPTVTGALGFMTPGSEVGLVQLRELFQRAGLRELERGATYAIESGRSRYALANWKIDLVHAVEGAFRYIAFDLTTAYGLHSGRALIIIVVVWALLIPVYIWPIRQMRNGGGIYRIWPKDRIEVSDGVPSAENAMKVKRLHGGTFASVACAAHFSLLSAFRIGFREFNVGTWLARIQTEKYMLEPTGWVRVLSGTQSLLSVYLLAMWALTYFGRPFQ